MHAHRQRVIHTLVHTSTHTESDTHACTYVRGQKYRYISTIESAGSDDDQGNMFSTFRMRNGEEYTVYNKDGKRYYVDWETQVSILINLYIFYYNI